MPIRFFVRDPLGPFSRRFCFRSYTVGVVDSEDVDLRMTGKIIDHSFGPIHEWQHAAVEHQNVVETPSGIQSGISARARPIILALHDSEVGLRPEPDRGLVDAATV